MFIAGISTIGIYFVRSSLQLLITTCFFSLTIVTGNFVIASVAVDVFPTYISAVAVSMMVCLGRFGAVVSNLAFGMLLDLSCEIPIFLLAGVAICEYRRRDIITELNYIVFSILITDDEFEKIVTILRYIEFSFSY